MTEATPAWSAAPSPFAGSDWFDPLEQAVRGQVRTFIEQLLEEELEAALGRRLGVHHDVEVGLDLVVQVLGRVGEQVALLVHGAALHRHVIPQTRKRRLEPFAAVDDDQLRLGEAPRHQIVEDGRARRLPSRHPCS